MQMNDSQRIPASKEKVWAALNDPEVLKKCIPGCQNLEMSSPTEMTATVGFRVGPVKATFGGGEASAFLEGNAESGKVIWGDAILVDFLGGVFFKGAVQRLQGRV